MGTNTAGNLLIADGTNFNSVAVGSLGEISTVASDDVFLAVDTSGGGLKKITRSTLVAGLATSTGIGNVVEDTTPQLGGDLDGQDKNLEDIVLSSATSHAGRYGSSSSPLIFTVTVASKSGHPYQGDGSSSAYVLNGLQAPALTLYGVDNVTSDSGYYYRFDQSDSSNSGHPLRFYLDADKTTAYTTNVTTNGTAGSSGAYTQIIVTEDTPSILYYQCSSHEYMGNHAVVIGSNKINHSEALIDMPTSSGTLALTSQLVTTGISSGNVGTFASGVADNDFLRIDGTSIEGLSDSEVLTAIGGQASLTFGIANTNAVKIDSGSVANGEFAKFTANGLESRSTAELSSDIGAATTDDIIALSIALG